MNKRLTEKRLLNITLFYLSRYESSTDKVRLMLQRRLKRMALKGEEIPSEAETWINNVIQKVQDDAYLNDSRYAENQVRLLINQGKSEQFILAKLKQAGIPRETVLRFIEASGTNEQERAITLMKRKKIGPYRSQQSPEQFKKDMGVLARAGFSYETIRAVLPETENTSAFSEFIT